MSKTDRNAGSNPLSSHPTAAFYTSVMPEKPHNAGSSPFVLHLPYSNGSDDLSALVSSFSAAHKPSACSSRPQNIRRPTFLADNTEAMNTAATRSKLAGRPRLLHNQTSPTLDHHYDMTKSSMSAPRHHIDPHHSLNSDFSADIVEPTTAVAVSIPVHRPSGISRPLHEKKPSLVDITRPSSRPHYPSPPQQRRRSRSSSSLARDVGAPSLDARGRSHSSSRTRDESSSRVRRPTQRVLRLLSSSKDHTQSQKSSSTSQLPTTSRMLSGKLETLPHHHSDTGTWKGTVSGFPSSGQNGIDDISESNGERVFGHDSIEEEQSEAMSPKAIKPVCKIAPMNDGSDTAHAQLQKEVNPYFVGALDNNPFRRLIKKPADEKRASQTSDGISPKMVVKGSPGFKKPSFPESISHGQSILALSDSEEDDNDEDESKSEPERKVSFAEPLKNDAFFDSHLTSNYWTNRRKSSKRRLRPQMQHRSKTMSDLRALPEVLTPAAASPDPGMSDSRSSTPTSSKSPEETSIDSWLMSPTMSAYTPSRLNASFAYGSRQDSEPELLSARLPRPLFAPLPEPGRETPPKPTVDPRPSNALPSFHTRSRQVMSVTLEEAELLATMRRRREMVQHRLMGVADDLAINPSQAFGRLQDVPESPTTTIDDDDDDEEHNDGAESEILGDYLPRQSFSSNLRSSLSGQVRPPSASDSLNQVWADVQAWRKAKSNMNTRDSYHRNEAIAAQPGAAMRSRGRKPPPLKHTVTCDGAIPLSGGLGTTDHAATYLNAGWKHGPRSNSIWTPTSALIDGSRRGRTSCDNGTPRDVTKDIMAAWNELGGWRRSGMPAV
ncbi:MAG: hypothetical protein M1828_002494 [Chrysothrix sp. TS-e1954]|nr:MAG: hypothetical protein M1828_002494 [Chrysothrix sp. TS-e1954]